jgi:hypothetical protein
MITLNIGDFYDEMRKLFVHSGRGYYQYLVADIKNHTASTYMCTSIYQGLLFCLFNKPFPPGSSRKAFR